jgi:phosphatidate cytidylyltransferase
MLSTRILTAVVLIAAVLAALFLLPPLAWALLSLLLIALGAHEWARLIGLPPKWQIVYFCAIVGIGVLLLLAAPSSLWPSHIVLAVCGLAAVFWIVVVPPWLHARWRVRSPWLGAIVGVVALVPAWLAIAQLHAQSPARLLAAMAIVWIADTAAYFTGRAFGRHKLAPEISPGKTWEGVAGGVAGVMIYAIVIAGVAPAWLSLPTRGAAIAWVVFAMAVAAWSVCGDLFESLQKRQAGVKDSGQLLPGHGGILDRIDALLAAMPLLALGSLLL